jgi:hypothetical protein
MNTVTLIFTIWVLFAVLLIIAMYGYKFKVLKTLGEYGRDDIEKGLPSNQLKQIQEYKRVCIENNLTLKWYRYMAAFPILATLAILAWVALILFSE